MATPKQLGDAFDACADLYRVCRRLVRLRLDELRMIEDHLAQLDPQMSQLLAHRHDAVQRSLGYRLGLLLAPSSTGSTRPTSIVLLLHAYRPTNSRTV